MLVAGAISDRQAPCLGLGRRPEVGDAAAERWQFLRQQILRTLGAAYDLLVAERPSAGVLELATGIRLASIRSCRPSTRTRSRPSGHCVDLGLSVEDPVEFFYVLCLILVIWVVADALTKWRADKAAEEREQRRIDETLARHKAKFDEPLSTSGELGPAEDHRWQQH
jgi:hypothetical protein